MIITKTPFRMSFFGGGTDIPAFYENFGGSVLSTTFDKYCYVNIRHLPRFFSYENEFVYSNIERVDFSLDNIVHPLIRETMKYMNMREIRLSYEADLPARTGLGTSSSFAVGMLNGFYALKGKMVDKRKLADDAIFIERVLCNESGGIQDQIAASFGGFNRIDMDSNGYTVNPIIISNKRKMELNENLMLFFTGFSRFSSSIQISTEKSIADKTAELIEIKNLVNEAEKILTSKQDLNEFGRLLDFTWQLKRGISSEISSNTIDDIYHKAINAGAIGGKLLGAGGGGFLLFYAEKDKQEYVRKKLDNLLYVPFKFEDDGTRVIYYKVEDYEMV